MIRLHEKVVNNQNENSVEDSPILSQNQTSSFLADTVILSSNLQSDDSQTCSSDPSQNSFDSDDNTLPIDYSRFRENSTTSDVYSSALSHENIGSEHLTNMQGTLERLKSELMVHSGSRLNLLNDCTGPSTPCLMETIMKNNNEQTIAKRDDIKRKQGNSRTTLLVKEMKEIQTDINMIQKSHDNLSEFCSKSEELLRQNKIKLEEIQTRLNMFQQEDYGNNFACIEM